MHIDSFLSAQGESSIDLRLKSNLQITFTPDTSLQEIANSLTNNTQFTKEEVQFFTINGSKLPLSEKVKNNLEYPVLLQLANDRIFAINFSQAWSISNEEQRNKISSEEHYFDFAKGIGFKNYELFSLPYFSEALMNALPKNKKELSKDEIADSMTTVLRYLSSEDNHHNGYGMINYGKLLARREELLIKVADVQAKIDANKKSAKRYTKMILWAGSGVGFAQFAFIFWGTFHTYSWDIMEPICYLMTFGNFTAGFLFYLKMGEDLELANLNEILTKRFTDSACLRQGIDLIEHEANKAEIRELTDALQGSSK